jgi:hypothetical protein
MALFYEKQALDNLTAVTPATKMFPNGIKPSEPRQLIRFHGVEFYLDPEEAQDVVCIHPQLFGKMLEDDSSDGIIDLVKHREGDGL